MNEVEFRKRLTELREIHGVSAREMSLSLGQNACYINNIENDRGNPSLSSFFNICDYLKITPAEFFETDSHNPAQLNELIKKLKRLDAKQLETLTAFVEQMIR
ncbi:MAG TPA: XRE family transcriptional regulator [Ruminococcaceae bacterium]|nr:XRE family transcriptional regulator [Oscillospiraceae bacterium]